MYINAEFNFDSVYCDFKSPEKDSIAEHLMLVAFYILLLRPFLRFGLDFKLVI